MTASIFLIMNVLVCFFIFGLTKDFLSDFRAAVLNLYDRSVYIGIVSPSMPSMHTLYDVILRASTAIGRTIMIWKFLKEK